MSYVESHLIERKGDYLKETSGNQFGHIQGSLVRGGQALKLCLAETYNLCELDLTEMDGLNLSFDISVFSALFNINPLLKSIHSKHSHWQHSTKYKFYNQSIYQLITQSSLVFFVPLFIHFNAKEMKDYFRTG